MKESEARNLMIALQQQMEGGLVRDEANKLRKEYDEVILQLREARAEADRQR